MKTIKSWIGRHYLPLYALVIFICLFCIGLFYPIYAVMTTLTLNHLQLNWTNIVAVHKLTPLLILIDTIPGVFFIFAHITVHHYILSKNVKLDLIQTLDVLNQEKLRREIETDQKLNILETSPVSYVIISCKGVITFANHATTTILGSNKTVGLNVLAFNTVKNSPLEASILSAMDGHTTTLRNYHHISASTQLSKVLNITLTPFERCEEQNSYNVLMISTDITQEVELLKKVDAGYLNTVKSLALALDARDRYTSEHSINVKHYTEIMVNSLDLAKDEKENICIAAELHDIGKIGVSDSVLNKSGSLSQQEFDLMKKHPTIGADLLKGIEGYHQISDIIRYHHERIDGRGYPAGLKDQQIPIGSRIICIADAFEAMTTDRVYRKALTFQSAINELINGKGTQFDATLVDLFLKHIHNYKTQY